MLLVRLDEELLAAVDKMVRKLKTTRSAFTRKALTDAIERLNVSRLEQRHKQGYAQCPVARNEFSVWENEQKCHHICVGTVIPIS